MKRLNLAKQNMLRSCPLDSGSPASPSENMPDASPTRASDLFGPPTPGFHRRSPSVDSDDSMMSRWSTSWRPDGERPDPESRKEEASKEEETVESGLRCSLRVDVKSNPKLRLKARGLDYLELEAVDLPIGSSVEVQQFSEGVWITALPAKLALSPRLVFRWNDLPENSSHRLRLHIVIEPEPLRIMFAGFCSPAVVEQLEPHHDPEGFYQDVDLDHDDLDTSSAEEEEDEDEDDHVNEDFIL